MPYTDHHIIQLVFRHVFPGVLRECSAMHWGFLYSYITELINIRREQYIKLNATGSELWLYINCQLYIIIVEISEIILLSSLYMIHNYTLFGVLVFIKAYNVRHTIQIENNRCKKIKPLGYILYFYTLKITLS